MGKLHMRPFMNLLSGNIWRNHHIKNSLSCNKCWIGGNLRFKMSSCYWTLPMTSHKVEFRIAGNMVHASLHVHILLSSIAAVACRHKYAHSLLSHLAASWIVSVTTRNSLQATCVLYSAKRHVATATMGWRHCTVQASSTAKAALTSLPQHFTDDVVASA